DNISYNKLRWPSILFKYRNIIDVFYFSRIIIPFCNIQAIFNDKSILSYSNIIYIAINMDGNCYRLGLEWLKNVDIILFSNKLSRTYRLIRIVRLIWIIRNNFLFYDIIPFIFFTLFYRRKIVFINHI